MAEMKLALREDRKEFRPGEELAGAAYWKLDQQPKLVEVRLFWFTRGKGTEDVEVIEKFMFDNPQMEEARPFKFRLPGSPYSFSGNLISLTWAVELVAKPAREAKRIEFVLSPSGGEIVLSALASAGRA